MSTRAVHNSTFTLLPLHCALKKSLHSTTAHDSCSQTQPRLFSGLYIIPLQYAWVDTWKEQQTTKENTKHALTLTGQSLLYVLSILLIYLLTLIKNICTAINLPILRFHELRCNGIMYIFVYQPFTAWQLAQPTFKLNTIFWCPSSTAYSKLIITKKYCKFFQFVHQLSFCEQLCNSQARFYSSAHRSEGCA